MLKDGEAAAKQEQKRKADEKEHVSNTEETYALVHHICDK